MRRIKTEPNLSLSEYQERKAKAQALMAQQVWFTFPTEKRSFTECKEMPGSSSNSRT